MFSCFTRIVLLLIVCFALAHAYPQLMGSKLLSAHAPRPRTTHDGETYDYFNSADGNDNEMTGNGFSAWLLRSRKFCCAPPL